MSRRDYPRVGGGRPVPAVVLGSVCCACAEPAAARVWVQWSYMRGEDEAEPVCKRHQGMAGSQPSRFIAHMMTKDRHLERKCEAP